MSLQVGSSSSSNSSSNSINSNRYRYQIVLSSLIPSTEYELYCSTTNPYEPFKEMSLDEVKQTRQMFTTGCCKTVSVELMTKSLPAGLDAFDIIKIRLDHLPSKGSLQIAPLSSCFDSIDAAAAAAATAASSSSSSSSTTTTCSTIPKMLAASTASSTTVYYASIPRTSLLGGEEGFLKSISISISVSGSASSEYYSRAVFMNNNRSTISILSSDATPPAPELSSVVFSSDGAFAVASFDSKTNRGYLPPQSADNKETTDEVTVLFACSQIFHIIPQDNDIAATYRRRRSLITSGGGGKGGEEEGEEEEGGEEDSRVAAEKLEAYSQAKCIWISDSKVVIYSSVLSPKDRVSVKADALKAYCTSIYPSVCLSYDNVESTKIIEVAPPEEPVAPIAVVNIASTLSTTSDLYVDTTGSLGNGGRPWKKSFFFCRGCYYIIIIIIIIIIDIIINGCTFSRRSSSSIITR